MNKSRREILKDWAAAASLPAFASTVTGTTVYAGHLADRRREENLEQELETYIEKSAGNVVRDIEEIGVGEISAEGVDWSVRIGEDDRSEVVYEVPVDGVLEGENAGSVLENHEYLLESGASILDSMTNNLSEHSGTERGEINSYGIEFSGSDGNVLDYSTSFGEISSAILSGSTASEYFRNTAERKSDLE